MSQTSGQHIAQAFSHLLDSHWCAALASVIDTDTDYHYQTGWNDAIEAAAKIVNSARFGEIDTDLRSIRAHIQGLKESQ